MCVTSSTLRETLTRRQLVFTSSQVLNVQLDQFSYLVLALLAGFWFFHRLRKDRPTSEVAARAVPPGWASLREAVTQEAGAVNVLSPAVFGAHVPEDSILRRHFITHVRHMLESVALPYPTDSVLCRHTEQLLEAEWAHCLHDEARLSRLVADYDAVRAEAAANWPPRGDSPQEAAAVCADEERAPCATPAWVPEDSVLRRHFLTHCRYMLEQVMSPAPTDSILVRHHEQLLESELAGCLQQQAQMEQLLDRYAEFQREL